MLDLDAVGGRVGTRTTRRSGWALNYHTEAERNWVSIPYLFLLYLGWILYEYVIREYCSGDVLEPAFLKPSFGCTENP